MRSQQGFVPVILVIAVVIVVTTILGAYLLLAKKQLSNKKEQPQVSIQQASPSPKPQVTPQPASLLFGLWEAEKMFIYDQKSGWQETQLTTGVYFDFKEDGTTCGLWSIDRGYQCHNYNDTYKVEGDRIIIERKNQQWKIGETPIPSTQVYKWKIVDSKLELTGIGPFFPAGVRYISRRTPYPQSKQ